MKKKRCPFCMEEIHNLASKCKYCHEWLITENEIEKLVNVTLYSHNGGGGGTGRLIPAEKRNNART